MQADLPAPVQAYLRTTLLEEMQPLCLQVDGDCRLVQYWGNRSTYGLEQMQIGANAPDYVPLLVGTVDTEEALELRFVDLGAAQVAHVHILPHGALRYVVLLNVNEAHAYLRDVQQRSHDARLRNHYDQRLVQRLRETQCELEQKKREAESASALKSRFIAAMSHEFRTPLTSVLGYAEIGAADETLDREQLRLCNQAVRRNATHLLNMVDNLIDQARLEADVLEINREPVALVQLADALRDMFLPLCRQKGLAFALQQDEHTPRIVLADGMRLQQILINLLGNAVKFTDCGEVRLRIGGDGEQLVFDLADTGPGIAREEQRRIFEPFQRSGDGRRPGAGLGLSIARELLERMGGSLALDSAAGAGTRWTLRLPVEVPASDTAAPQPVPSAPARLAGRLLLVEDNPDIAALVKLFLHNSGVILHCCADGASALDELAHFRPELALVDLMLPDMGGDDFLRAARAAGHDLDAVAFTATPRHEVEQRLARAGFKGYLAKPVMREQLLALLSGRIGPGAAAPPSAGEAALLRAYRESLPTRRAQFAELWQRCQAVADESGDELASTLHQLAGSAGAYGYPELSAAARTALARWGSAARATPASAAPAMQALLDAFERAIDA